VTVREELPEDDATSRAVDALERIAELLEFALEPSYRVKAFRGAAAAIRDIAPDDLEARAKEGKLQALSGVGEKTAKVIEEALAGKLPAYLRKLEEDSPEIAEGPGAEIRAALKGDCHCHSDWSDGGSPVDEMARAARDLGHHYMVMTDHSPRLTVARGLTPDRLRAQLELIDQINEEMAPFRILKGIEVDINEDGSLDQTDELLAELDVVVASVHSKLGGRMTEGLMTQRMVKALRNPFVDILGHCTGRKVTGKGRPESPFDAEKVFSVALEHDKAIEINCRPERRDPPKRLIQLALDIGCKFSMDTDAHAPGQLRWQPYGCDRAAEVGVPVDRIVNTMDADGLTAWAASHR
jgi:putative hydrolase